MREEFDTPTTQDIRQWRLFLASQPKRSKDARRCFSGSENDWKRIFSESISSGQSVLIKIWCSVEILKLIWPKKVTLAKLNSTLGSVVPLAMFRNIISAFNLIAYCSQTQGKAVWSYKITFSYYEREICQHRQLKVRPGLMKSFLSWWPLMMAAWSSSVLISCYRVPTMLRPWQSFWTSQAMQPSVFSFVCPSLSFIVHLSSP